MRRVLEKFFSFLILAAEIVNVYGVIIITPGSRFRRFRGFQQLEGLCPEPKIDFLNETAAQLTLANCDGYKYFRILSVIWVKSEEEGYKKEEIDVTGNRETTMTRNFGLKPGTTYIVRAKIKIKLGHDPAILHTRHIKFTTLCRPSTIFELTPLESSVMLNHIQHPHAIYPCPANWYSVVIEKISTGTLNRPRIGTDDFPLEFANLSPSTSYKIHVYRRNRILFIANITTLVRASSQVQNLRNTSVSSTHITLKWDPPAQPNGVITRYAVQTEVQKYLGCEDLSHRARSKTIITLTSNRAITLRTLHPYTTYVISVAAFTSKFGERAEVYVTTKPLETPTAVFSELRFNNDVFSWGDPVDCTTITGPIKGSKITFKGISKNVISFYDERYTSSNLFRFDSSKQVIYGAETYRARMYALRYPSMKYNESAYIELTFTTPPKVPPPIRYLERYEMDPDAKTLSIRWKEPQSPMNGQIEFYAIIHCNIDYQNATFITTVSFNQTCQAWDDYICATFEQPTERFSYIGVRAHNKNVSEGGPYVYLEEDLKEIAPTPPEDIESTVLDGAVIELNWTHPWYPGNPLELFLITIHMNATKLSGENSTSWKPELYKHIISRYQQYYRLRLYLKPSSSYTLEVSARSKLHSESSVIELHTPSCLAFESELKWVMYSRNATIRLDIPLVINDTANSAMYVVVVGARPCEEYSQVGLVLGQQIGIKYDEKAWVAARLSTSEYSGDTFIVGDNRVYGDATNCPLRTGGTYSIIVAVQSEKGSITDQFIVGKTSLIYIGDVLVRRIEAWVGAIVIFSTIFVMATLCWWRKRNAMQEIDVSIEMSLSENFKRGENGFKQTRYKKAFTKS